MNLDMVRALVDRQAEAWMQENMKKALADFAADAVFQSPGGRWRGHDEIRQAGEEYFAVATGIGITVDRVLFDGRYGAVEWTWLETQRATGRRHGVQEAIIFELEDDKIVYWREYFDTAQLALPLETS